MLSGSYPALITPFTSQDVIDFKGLTQILEMQRSSKSAGWVVLGSTAEALSLQNDERKEVLHAVADILPRERTIVGVSAGSTAEIIKNTEQAYRLGFKTVLLATPFYSRPSQDEMVMQYKKVLEAVPVKVVAYTVPSRTGIDFNDSTILELAGLEGLVALKDAGGDIMRSLRLHPELPGDFAYLSGDDTSLPLRLFAGCKGVISVCANILPDAVQAVCQAANQGHWSEVQSAYDAIRPVLSALDLGPNPCIIKYMMSKTFAIEPRLREPLSALKQAHLRQAVDTLMRQQMLL